MVLNTDTRKDGKLGLHKDKVVSDDDEPATNHSKKNLGKQPKAAKSEYEEKIRVGKDYQVSIPSLRTHLEPKYDDGALLIWQPTGDDIPDARVEEYIALAREKYGYTVDQALGMLFWHKNDLEKAAMDLANYTPLRDQWSKEDKILFEQAFQFHGKCFHRIRQMLPDKSIADLVRYYYTWKKSRNRLSVMDRQEQHKKDGVPGEAAELANYDEPEVEEKKWPIRGIRRSSRSPVNRIVSPMLDISNAVNPSTSSAAATNAIKLRAQRFGSKQGNENKDTGYSSSSSSSNGNSKDSASLNCQNCTVRCNELKSTMVGNFCASCFNHWRRTGMMRPTQGPYNMGIEVNQRPRSKTNKLYYYQGYHDGSIKYKRKPPKGMWINHDDVRKLAAQDANANEMGKSAESNDLLKEVETEMEILLSHIQTNKQKISKLKSTNNLFQDNRLQEESSLNRANSRWTKEEVALARLGFMKYRNNPKAIAEMIGTKTEAHVRKKLKESIFQDLHAEIKASNETKVDANNEIMEIDSDDETATNGEHNKTEKLSSEVTITPIRKPSKDVPVETSSSA